VALHFAVLAGLIGLSIGFAGIVIGGFANAFGKDYVAGDLPGTTYTPDRCQDFLRFYPGAPDCQSAATNHHFDEVVRNHIAAGVLGILVLAGAFAVRRKFVRSEPSASLARRLRNVGGLLAFGAVTGPLLLVGIGLTLRDSSTGGGTWLAEGIASLVFLLLFLRPGVRSRREMAADYAA
jgi:hypothetical protein